MPNLAAVLKQEIGRLARKEARAALAPTRQQVLRHRRDVARLKRDLEKLRRKIAQLESRTPSTSLPSQVDESTVAKARFSPKSVRAHRKRLGLSADEYARLVGVSMQTIYHWEQGKSRPRKSQMASLVAVRQLGKRDALHQLAMIDQSQEALSQKKKPATSRKTPRKVAARRPRRARQAKLKK